MPLHLHPLKSTLFACALALAACSTTKTSAPDAQGGASTAMAGQAGTSPGAAGSAAGQSTVASVDLTGTRSGDDAGPAVVYFDFDSFVVKDEFRPVVESGARKLTGDRKRHVTVEGYADERGSSEYNLALGQRRAEAVVKSMQLLGAATSQMEPVSYGDEHPAVAGHDEAAWAKNRRAQIVAR
jgi:peptidoglycan-associated lipoprotein